MRRLVTALAQSGTGTRWQVVSGGESSSLDGPRSSTHRGFVASATTVAAGRFCARGRSSSSFLKTTSSAITTGGLILTFGLGIGISGMDAFRKRPQEQDETDPPCPSRICSKKWPSCPGYRSASSPVIICGANPHLPRGVTGILEDYHGAFFLYTSTILW